MRVRDVPLGARTLAGGAAPVRFNMLGLHWIGGRHASTYRTRTSGGRWRAWRGRATPDNRSGAWHDGNLDWIGRVGGRPVPHAPGRSGGCAPTRSASRVTTAPVRAAAAAGAPVIVSRVGWGADEEIVRAKPLDRPDAQARRRPPHGRHELVHARRRRRRSCAASRSTTCRGTAGTTSATTFSSTASARSTRAAAAASTQNVIGAHAHGFNSGTVGVALIGNYTAAVPPPAQQDALVSLLAWRLDVAHVDPLSTVVYTSGGNAKFRAGQARDAARGLGSSRHRAERVPGQPRVRAAAGAGEARSRATGLPKLYAPTAAGVARRPDPLPGAALVAACLDA